MTDAPAIECRGLRRVYDEGQVTALAGVDLVVPAGQYVVILGPSGCGKSTLLNMLGALDLPTAGHVSLGGRELRSSADLDAARLEQIGFIFQSFYLLPTLTAVENVQIPMLESRRPLGQRVARAKELLGAVGMGHRLRHLPTKLSGGERQRVAIARALANDPPLLLADEPTGNLDSKTGKEILGLFDRMHREQRKTIVCVTHSQEVAERAGRVIRMLDGQIIEDVTRAA